MHRRLPNCITALCTSLPLTEVEAIALVTVLRSSATLRTLGLIVQAPDWVQRLDAGNLEAEFQVPSMGSPVVPNLEALRAPIEWALAMVPGRPIHSLKVYRSKNKAYEAEREDPVEILRGLSMSTAHMQTLAITCLGEDFEFPPLQAIIDFFPQVTTLAFSVLDVGALIDLSSLVRPPARSPDRPEAIWGMFKIPTSEELEEGMRQIEENVEEDLASSHEEAYRNPIDSAQPTVTCTYQWGVEELQSVPDTFKILTAPNTFSGVLYRVATIPQQYPLPPKIQELHVYQYDFQQQTETDFGSHEQRVIFEMLGHRYPHLTTVVFRRECAFGFPSRWKLCGRSWELRDCPDK